jgi:phosphatidylglycerol:prolipoprotein diacylglycerol transferase
MVAFQLRERGHPPQWGAELVLAGFVLGGIGARAYYLVQHHEPITRLSLHALVAGGGAVWYGGMAGGAVGYLGWAARRRLPLATALDIAAPAVAAGYVLGRLGCQLAGDGDYGTPSDLPWAMGYPDGLVPTPPGVEVHPTPVYEMAASAAIAAFLWPRRRAYAPGTLFALYLVPAGVERFLVELVRRNPAVAAGLTAAQLLSVGLVVLGAAWLARATVTHVTRLPGGA